MRAISDYAECDYANHEPDWLHTATLGLGVTSPVGWLGACALL